MNTLLKKQRDALFHTPPPGPFEPLSTYDTSGCEEDAKRGGALLQAGKVGCLILSGGQGSRMESLQPKGLIPVTPQSKKPLLQLFCEQVRLAGLFPLAVMTSPLNHNEIANFLERQAFFGLDIDLFLQEMLPFLDDRGDWIFEASGKAASGPDGNGYALRQFVASGIWEKWHRQGVEYLTIIPVDNPLANPFDTELIGYLDRLQNDAAIKAIFRHDPLEKVGIIGLKKGKIGVREYTELPPDNHLFTLANINLFCFSFPFIKKISSIDLPWHPARKTAPIHLCTAKGDVQESAVVWKFETFLFDVLDYAEKTGVVVYPREKVYAPLKNSSGEKSLQSVQEALLAQNREDLL